MRQGFMGRKYMSWMSNDKYLSFIYIIYLNISHLTYRAFLNKGVSGSKAYKYFQCSKNSCIFSASWKMRYRNMVMKDVSHKIWLWPVMEMFLEYWDKFYKWLGIGPLILFLTLLITIILDLPYEQVDNSRVLENTKVEWDKTLVKLCFSHSKVSALSIGLLKKC